VWLDATGRPISDQIRVTERFRRLDYDTIEWSETMTIQGVFETVGDHEAHDAHARSPHRHHGVLLFTRGAAELQQLFGNGVDGK
jgi:hypothetical protein